MYNYLFYFFYSYYNRTEKWKEAKVPFFSTILVISVLLMFNFLFIRDFITFHLNGFRYQNFQYENFIVPTIFIGLNYWYFKKDDRFKRILSCHKNTKNKKNLKFYLAWSYMILSVVLLVLMGLSIKNNVRWFKKKNSNFTNVKTCEVFFKV